MARRANPAGGTTDSAEMDEKTPLEGGASGVLENAITEVGGGAGKVQASAFRSDPNAPAPVPTKKYEAFGCGPGGRFILLNGYKALIRDGRVVDEAFDDVAMMTAQGVSLRPLP
jgi:hypothetical protein